ncbi:unnamed protein product [Amoebophrya sp. A25]|nr:unnamed protein product [Amoebophrya sp. A25]|eukprot:GSA25T00010220001.1
MDHFGSRDVAGATIRLKTDPETTFYKLSDQPGTDPLEKKRTWKPRRKKVRAAYKVPGEYEDTVPEWATWSEQFESKTEAALASVEAELMGQEAGESEEFYEPLVQQEYVQQQMLSVQHAQILGQPMGGVGGMAQSMQGVGLGGVQAQAPMPLVGGDMMALQGMMPGLMTTVVPSGPPGMMIPGNEQFSEIFAENRIVIDPTTGENIADFSPEYAQQLQSDRLVQQQMQQQMVKMPQQQEPQSSNSRVILGQQQVQAGGSSSSTALPPAGEVLAGGTTAVGGPGAQNAAMGVSASPQQQQQAVGHQQRITTTGSPGPGQGQQQQTQQVVVPQQSTTGAAPGVSQAAPGSVQGSPAGAGGVVQQLGGGQQVGAGQQSAPGHLSPGGQQQQQPQIQQQQQNMAAKDAMALQAQQQVAVQQQQLAQLQQQMQMIQVAQPPPLQLSPQQSQQLQKMPPEQQKQAVQQLQAQHQQQFRVQQQQAMVAVQQQAVATATQIQNNSTAAGAPSRMSTRGPGMGIQPQMQMPAAMGGPMLQEFGQPQPPSPQNRGTRGGGPAQQLASPQRQQQGATTMARGSPKAGNTKASYGSSGGATGGPGGASVSPAKKGGSLFSQVQQANSPPSLPPRDPEERKKWESEQAFKDKKKGLVDNAEMNRARTDLMQFAIYADAGDVRDLQRKIDDYMDFAMRQAFDRWNVVDGEKAVKNQQNMRTQMVKAQQGYLQELQYHRYRNQQQQTAEAFQKMPPVDGKIQSDATKPEVIKMFTDGKTGDLSMEDGSRVILYDAITIFSEDEQELVRMIIDERVHQLMMYDPRRKKGGSPDDDEDKVSLDELNFVKNELISKELKMKTMEEEFSRKIVRFQDLIEELRGKCERLESELAEKDLRIQQLEEEVADLKMKSDEASIQADAEKFQLEGKVSEKQMEIDLLKKELEELRMGGGNLSGLDAGTSISGGNRSADETDAETRLRRAEEQMRAKYEDELAELKQKLRDAEDKIKAEVDAAAAKAYRDQQLSSKMGEAEVEQMKSDLVDLRGKVDELQRLLDEERGKNAEQEKLIADLRKQLQEERDSNEITNKKLKEAEELASKLSKKIHQLELVEQELLNQLAEINEIKDAEGTGKAFKGMMRKLGVNKGGSTRLMKKVFERLYYDAIERMERYVRLNQLKLNEQRNSWERILGARDLYGDNFLPNERPPASNHLLDAFQSLPDRSLVAALAPDDYTYLFAEPTTHPASPSQLRQHRTKRNLVIPQRRARSVSPNMHLGGNFSATAAFFGTPGAANAMSPTQFASMPGSGVVPPGVGGFAGFGAPQGAGKQLPNVHYGGVLTQDPPIGSPERTMLDKLAANPSSTPGAVGLATINIKGSGPPGRGSGLRGQGGGSRPSSRQFLVVEQPEPAPQVGFLGSPSARTSTGGPGGLHQPASRHSPNSNRTFLGSYSTQHKDIKQKGMVPARSTGDQHLSARTAMAVQVPQVPGMMNINFLGTTARSETDHEQMNFATTQSSFGGAQSQSINMTQCGAGENSSTSYMIGQQHLAGGPAQQHMGNMGSSAEVFIPGSPLNVAVDAMHSTSASQLPYINHSLLQAGTMAGTARGTTHQTGFATTMSTIDEDARLASAAAATGAVPLDGHDSDPNFDTVTHKSGIAGGALTATTSGSEAVGPYQQPRPHAHIAHGHAASTRKMQLSVTSGSTKTGGAPASSGGAFSTAGGSSSSSGHHTMRATGQLAPLKIVDRRPGLGAGGHIMSATHHAGSLISLQHRDSIVHMLPSGGSSSASRSMYIQAGAGPTNKVTNFNRGRPTPQGAVAADSIGTTSQAGKVKVGSPRAHQNQMRGDHATLKSPRVTGGFERSPTQLMIDRPTSPTRRFFTGVSNPSAQPGVVNMTANANVGDAHFRASHPNSRLKQGPKCEHCGVKMTH